MFIDALKKVFDRDIAKVIDEINSYENDHDIWKKPSGINNTAGTLALHIAGNLQHFIGAVLGNSGYKRDREAEFNLRDVPSTQIVSELEKAREVVNQTLDNLDPGLLDKDYPEGFYNQSVTMYFMLVHLHGHLNYHLGQINYHRRLLTGQ